MTAVGEKRKWSKMSLYASRINLGQFNKVCDSIYPPPVLFTPFIFLPGIPAGLTLTFLNSMTKYPPSASSFHPPSPIRILGQNPSCPKPASSIQQCHTAMDTHHIDNVSIHTALHTALPYT